MQTANSGDNPPTGYEARIVDCFRATPLVIAKLGSGGDSFSFIPAFLRPVTILITLDAGAEPTKEPSGAFLRRIGIRNVVAGDRSPRAFIEREFWGCSSLLELLPDTVARFALDETVKERGRTVVHPDTFPEILAANAVPPPDLLITDLEGLDLEVIKSCEPFLPRVLLLQCEHRFHPFYQGEAPFHETASYLASRGFEIIGLRPEYWRPLSRRRDRYSDGVISVADCLYMRRIPEQGGNDQELALAKQVVLLSLMQKDSMAAHVLERHSAQLDPALASALGVFIAPAPPAVRVLRVLRRQLLMLKAELALFRSYQALRRSLRRIRGKYFDAGHLSGKIENI